MNEQEEFWKGSFGTEYSQRNSPSVEVRMQFFTRALARIPNPESIIEFGANKGHNLAALHRMFGNNEDLELAAVEINDDAIQQLGKLRGNVDILHQSILGAETPCEYDLSFTMGLLIHLAPEDLPRAYDALHHSSGRYILIAEYFAPSPTPVFYRGHKDRLWRRDFAGEMLDRFSDLKLVDYGFFWRRDPVTPMDDVSWFLMERCFM